MKDGIMGGLKKLLKGFDHDEVREMLDVVAVEDLMRNLHAVAIAENALRDIPCKGGGRVYSFSASAYNHVAFLSRDIANGINRILGEYDGVNDRRKGSEGE